MKKKKTNIYLEYFKSQNTILNQTQKRLFIVYMMFAGLFVIQTIGGMNIVALYALVGMLSIATISAYWLTEGGEPVDDWSEPLLLEHKPIVDSSVTESMAEIENVK